jgi:glucosamine--fructose-6-phosphate aminotransferase (isomerizing)
MCGICGITYTKTQPKLGTILADLAQRLSYRGYDTAGIATIDNSNITLRKDAGKLEPIRRKYKFDQLTGNKGIAQLRWATFGVPSKKNAQPHFDSDKKLVGAHNGNILNTLRLNDEFRRMGMTVRSDNDGEVCVHAIERYFRKNGNMLKAMSQAFRLLEGDYAYTITDPRDDLIYVIKKGSSLALGIGDGFTCFSSDLPSLLPLTKKILRINDGEIARLSPHGIELFDARTTRPIKRSPYRFQGDHQSAQKGDYPHFFLKEVNEQSDRALELVEYYRQSPLFAKLAAAYRKAEDIYVAGCGTSYHACLLGAYYLNHYASPDVVPCLAYDLENLYAQNITKRSLICLVSQSGETKDVVNILKTCNQKRIPTAGVVNVIGSTLSNDATYPLPILAGYEVSVAATKTFTNQAVLFLLLAHYLAGKRCNTKQLKHALSFANQSQLAPTLRKIAKLLVAYQEFYYLGYGQTVPIASEGALKIKEITYLHCEALNSAEFKHGPLSAVRPGYPVLFVVDKHNNKRMQNQIHEVLCRQGRPIVIGPPDPDLARLGNPYIKLPDLDNDYLPLAANTVLQLIAYYACLERGLDPDKPRNLSKTITVD